MEQKICKHCKKPFVPRTAWQRYHDTACQNRAGQARLRARAKKATKVLAS